MNTIKKLVAFGCSWTFGDELEDPALADQKDNPRYWDMNSPYRMQHNYAGLLAQHYNLEYINHAFPGASLDSMRDAMTWYTKHHDMSNTFFVIGLTESWRTSWHNAQHRVGKGDPEWNRHVNSAWLLHGSGNYSSSWQHTFRAYMEDQLCEELQYKRLEQTLLFFDGISARYNTPMIQVNMLEALPNVIGVRTHAYPDECATHYLDQWKPKDVLARGGHPNEKGHEHVADWLIKYIDSAIIAE